MNPWALALLGLGAYLLMRRQSAPPAPVGRAPRMWSHATAITPGKVYRVEAQPGAVASAADMLGGAAELGLAVPQVFSPGSRPVGGPVDENPNAWSAEGTATEAVAVTDLSPTKVAAVWESTPIAG